MSKLDYTDQIVERRKNGQRNHDSGHSFRRNRTKSRTILLLLLELTAVIAYRHNEGEFLCERHEQQKDTKNSSMFHQCLKYFNNDVDHYHTPCPPNKCYYEGFHNGYCTKCQNETERRKRDVGGENVENEMFPNRPLTRTRRFAAFGQGNVMKTRSTKCQTCFVKQNPFRARDRYPVLIDVQSPLPPCRTCSKCQVRVTIPLPPKPKPRPPPPPPPPPPLKHHHPLTGFAPSHGNCITDIVKPAAKQSPVRLANCLRRGYGGNEYWKHRCCWDADMQMYSGRRKRRSVGGQIDTACNKDEAKKYVRGEKPRFTNCMTTGYAQVEYWKTRCFELEKCRPAAPRKTCPDSCFKARNIPKTSNRARCFCPSCPPGQHRILGSHSSTSQHKDGDPADTRVSKHKGSSNLVYRQPPSNYHPVVVQVMYSNGRQGYHPLVIQLKPKEYYPMLAAKYPRADGYSPVVAETTLANGTKKYLPAIAQVRRPNKTGGYFPLFAYATRPGGSGKYYPVLAQVNFPNGPGGYYPVVANVRKPTDTGGCYPILAQVMQPDTSGEKFAVVAKGKGATGGIHDVVAKVTLPNGRVGYSPVFAKAQNYVPVVATTNFPERGHFPVFALFGLDPEAPESQKAEDGSRNNGDGQGYHPVAALVKDPDGQGTYYPIYYSIKFGDGAEEFYPLFAEGSISVGPGGSYPVVAEVDNDGAIQYVPIISQVKRPDGSGDYYPMIAKVHNPDPHIGLGQVPDGAGGYLPDANTRYGQQQNGAGGFHPNANTGSGQRPNAAGGFNPNANNPSGQRPNVAGGFPIAGDPFDNNPKDANSPKYPIIAHGRTPDGAGAFHPIVTKADPIEPIIGNGNGPNSAGGFNPNDPNGRGGNPNDPNGQRPNNAGGFNPNNPYGQRPNNAGGFNPNNPNGAGDPIDVVPQVLDSDGANEPKTGPNFGQGQHPNNAGGFQPMANAGHGKNPNNAGGFHPMANVGNGQNPNNAGGFHPMANAGHGQNPNNAGGFQPVDEPEPYPDAKEDEEMTKPESTKLLPVVAAVGNPDGSMVVHPIIAENPDPTDTHHPILAIMNITENAGGGQPDGTLSPVVAQDETPDGDKENFPVFANVMLPDGKKEYYPVVAQPLPPNTTVQFPDTPGFFPVFAEESYGEDGNEDDHEDPDSEKKKHPLVVKIEHPDLKGFHPIVSQIGRPDKSGGRKPVAKNSQKPGYYPIVSRTKTPDGKEEFVPVLTEVQDGLGEPEFFPVFVHLKIPIGQNPNGGDKDNNKRGNRKFAFQMKPSSNKPIEKPQKTRDRDKPKAVPIVIQVENPDGTEDNFPTAAQSQNPDDNKGYFPLAALIKEPDDTGRYPNKPGGKGPSENFPVVVHNLDSDSDATEVNFPVFAQVQHPNGKKEYYPVKAKPMDNDDTEKSDSGPGFFPVIAQDQLVNGAENEYPIVAQIQHPDFIGDYHPIVGYAGLPDGRRGKNPNVANGYHPIVAHVTTPEGNKEYIPVLADHDDPDAGEGHYPIYVHVKPSKPQKSNKGNQHPNRPQAKPGSGQTNQGQIPNKSNEGDKPKKVPVKGSIRNSDGTEETIPLAASLPEEETFFPLAALVKRPDAGAGAEFPIVAYEDLEDEDGEPFPVFAHVKHPDGTDGHYPVQTQPRQTKSPVSQPDTAGGFHPVIAQDDTKKYPIVAKIDHPSLEGDFHPLVMANQPKSKKARKPEANRYHPIVTKHPKGGYIPVVAETMNPDDEILEFSVFVDADPSGGQKPNKGNPSKQSPKKSKARDKSKALPVTTKVKNPNGKVVDLPLSAKTKQPDGPGENFPLVARLDKGDEDDQGDEGGDDAGQNLKNPMGKRPKGPGEFPVMAEDPNPDGDGDFPVFAHVMHPDGSKYYPVITKPQDPTDEELDIAPGFFQVTAEDKQIVAQFQHPDVVGENHPLVVYGEGKKGKKPDPGHGYHPIVALVTNPDGTEEYIPVLAESPEDGALPIYAHVKSPKSEPVHPLVVKVRNPDGTTDNHPIVAELDPNEGGLYPIEARIKHPDGTEANYPISPDVKNPNDAGGFPVVAIVQDAPDIPDDNYPILAYNKDPSDDNKGEYFPVIVHIKDPDDAGGYVVGANTENLDEAGGYPIVAYKGKTPGEGGGFPLVTQVKHANGTKEELPIAAMTQTPDELGGYPIVANIDKPGDEEPYRLLSQVQHPAGVPDYAPVMAQVQHAGGRKCKGGKTHTIKKAESAAYSWSDTATTVKDECLEDENAKPGRKGKSPKGNPFNKNSIGGSFPIAAKVKHPGNYESNYPIVAHGEFPSGVKGYHPVIGQTLPSNGRGGYYLIDRFKQYNDPAKGYYLIISQVKYCSGARAYFLLTVPIKHSNGTELVFPAVALVTRPNPDGAYPVYAPVQLSRFPPRYYPVFSHVQHPDGTQKYHPLFVNIQTQLPTAARPRIPPKKKRAKGAGAKPKGPTKAQQEKASQRPKPRRKCTPGSTKAQGSISGTSWAETAVTVEEKCVDEDDNRRRKREISHKLKIEEESISDEMTTQDKPHSLFNISDTQNHTLLKTEPSDSIVDPDAVFYHLKPSGGSSTDDMFETQRPFRYPSYSSAITYNEFDKVLSYYLCFDDRACSYCQILDYKHKKVLAFALDDC